MAKKKNYTYVWCKDGKICVRKEHGQEHVRIEREAGLYKWLGVILCVNGKIIISLFVEILTLSNIHFNKLKILQ